MGGGDRLAYIPNDDLAQLLGIEGGCGILITGAGSMGFAPSRNPSKFLGKGSQVRPTLCARAIRIQIAGLAEPEFHQGDSIRSGKAAGHLQGEAHDVCG